MCKLTSWAAVFITAVLPATAVLLLVACRNEQSVSQLPTNALPTNAIALYALTTNAPSSIVDYAANLECNLGETVRPTPSATVTFELLTLDPTLQQCGFEVIFDGSEEYHGVVKKGEYFDFCPKLHNGVYLHE